MNKKILIVIISIFLLLSIIFLIFIIHKGKSQEVQIPQEIIEENEVESEEESNDNENISENVDDEQLDEYINEDIEQIDEEEVIKDNEPVHLDSQYDVPIESYPDESTWLSNCLFYINAYYHGMILEPDGVASKINTFELYRGIGRNWIYVTYKDSDIIDAILMSQSETDGLIEYTFVHDIDITSKNKVIEELSLSSINEETIRPYISKILNLEEVNMTIQDME